MLLPHLLENDKKHIQNGEFGGNDSTCLFKANIRSTAASDPNWAAVPVVL